MSAVDTILDLFDRWGGYSYDEALSQRLHAEQTADLAVSAGAPPSLIAAALLHDIGHLVAVETEGSSAPPRDIDLRHEAVGARILAPVFPPSVTGPIALHVVAKRYLVATDADYDRSLSPGSRDSLRRQGGPMDTEECRRFELRPGFEAAVALRRWDDEAKDPARTAGGVSSHRALLETLVTDTGIRLLI